MPETITGYNTFVAGTKARSTEVNTNFSNHRGTILPITTNTATASDLTYNLGSTEYYWLNAYLRTVNIRGMTNTSNLVIERDNTVTTGSYAFKIGAVEHMRIGSTGTSFQTTTTFNAGGSARMTIDSSGVNIGTLTGINYRTSTEATSASVGNLARNATITSEYSSGATTGAGITVTSGFVHLACVGRPVMFGILAEGSDGYLEIRNNTTAAKVVARIERNGVVVSSWIHAGQQNNSVEDFIPSWVGVDLPNAGTNTYAIVVTITNGGSGGANTQISFRHARMFAYEM